MYMERNQVDTITILQAAMLVIITLAIAVHVELVPFLLKSAGRDAWAAELVCIPIAVLIWIGIWFVVRLGPRLSPLDRIPRWCQPLLIVLVDAFVIISLAQSLDSWQSFVGIVFLPGVPPPLVVISLVFTCIWIARHGLGTIAVTVGFLLPIIMVFGVMNSLGTMPDKQYFLLFPLLERGLSPFLQSVLIPIPIMGEFLIILFFAHQIRGKNALKLYPWLWTLGILAIISVGLVMGLLAEYGPYEVAHFRFPAFGGWRLLTFGEYIERLDYFAIYQWTAGLAGRMMVLLYITGQVFRHASIRLPHMVGVAVLAVIVTLWPIDISTKEWLRSIYYPIEAVMEVVTFLLFGIGSWFYRDRLPGGIQYD